MAEFDPKEFEAVKAKQAEFDPVEFKSGGTRTETGADGRPRVIMDMSKKPDRGVADATGRGVAQGLTANFSDEIRGLVEAGGANPDDPASVYKLVHGALKYWGGDAEAKTKYEETVARERALNKTAGEQHPVANTLGEIGGAIALPVGAAAGAATLPGRMAASAGVGAAYGGLSGAGAGEGAADSVSRATMGAGLGAVAGGVAPPVIEGAIQGVKAASGPIVNAIRGAVNPDSEASRRVATAITRDAAVDPAASARLSPGEFGANVQAGGPATIMDMGGNLTRRLADSAAITSPEAGTALNTAINNRFEGQASRVTNWLNDTFHYPNAHAQQQAIDDTARTVNRANYANAYRNGAKPLWDDTLQGLTVSPHLQSAIRDATKTGATDAAINGFRPPQNPFVFGADGAMTMRPGVHPTLQFWDQVKRNLDSQIGVAKRSGDDPLVSQLTQLKNQFVSHLDNLVPSYGQARAGAAHFFGAENALEAGQNFVGSKLGNDEARTTLAKMTPTERNLFRDGFVDRYIQTINEVGDRRSVLNKIAETPAARERLEMVLGPHRAAELEGLLRVEGIMDLARNAVQGNSWTARRLYDMGLAGGAGLGAMGGYNMDPKEMAAGAVMSALASGGKKIDSRVAQRVGEMLVSQDPQMMLRGIRLLSRNNGMMDSLRAVDRRIAAAGSEQVPTGGAVQALSPSRAEDKQPGIQGPL